MKKVIGLALCGILLLTAFTACGKAKETGTSDENGGQNAVINSVAGQTISVISREEGSGTRGAFIELFGIEQEDENGEKIDRTIPTAEITNSTGVMMQTVAGNKNAVGYISLGSLDDSVTGVKIDGVAPSVETVLSGDYKITRPFNIATMDRSNETAQDFLDFILSEQGQEVVENYGCASKGNNGPYNGNKPSGTVKVGGSSSVTPVMEKLKEAYEKINPNANIEITQNDSTTGMTSTIEGIYDIGMASRELKDSEISAGLKNTVIAIDGIAVIVNNDSGITELTSEEVKSIYTGEKTYW